MNELASERNNRRKRGQQASVSGFRADARLVRVSCQRGNQRRNLSDWSSLGIDTRADDLWLHRIADYSKVEQSNEQIIIRSRYT